MGTFTPPGMPGPTARFPGLSMGVMNMLMQAMQQQMMQQQQMQQDMTNRQREIEDRDAGHNHQMNMKMVDNQARDAREKRKQSQQIRPKRAKRY